jgi:hypothetical protein
VGLSFHLRSSADALFTKAMQMNLLKIWFNEFLQNAAFPAAVLAFACAPINQEIVDVRTGSFTDNVRAAKARTRHINPISREVWYQPTKSPVLKQDRET